MDIFESLAILIEAETGYPKQKVERGTRLYQDIKVDGDDAEDLLYKFSETFNVDMSNFEFNRYFNNEGLNSVAIVKSLFGFGKKRKLEALTIEMLEKSVTQGKWKF